MFLLAGAVILTLFFQGKETDPTERVELKDSNGNEVVIRSPSRSLIPTIAGLLESRGARPDKLIPEHVDLKDSPEQFVVPTEEDRKEIESKEIASALSDSSEEEPA